MNEELEYLTTKPEPTSCEMCGKPVPSGGWPFCASPRNPEGHSPRVTYGFKMGMSMKTNGWTRSKK